MFLATGGSATEAGQEPRISEREEVGLQERKQFGKHLDPPVGSVRRPVSSLQTTPQPLFDIPSAHRVHYLIRIR